MLCGLHRNRNQYRHEAYVAVLGLHDRTQNVQFLLRQDVHHIELECLLRQLLTLSALTYALRVGTKHVLQVVLQFLAQQVGHLFLGS